jgi:DNA topoisomerase VI subunit B
MKTFARTTFATSRLLEFFTEAELAMQIGHDRPLWAAAILKELLDNALDACEKAGILPSIQVRLKADVLEVQDNGPGLPTQTLQRSLEYDVRVSDNAYYVSPTRGRLGNALKCVWAAPLVVNGSQGRVEVAARGVLHRIDVRLDGISQKPRIDTAQEPSLVKTGTFLRLHWPLVASCLTDAEQPDFYTASRLLRAYALFNPHATLSLKAFDAEVTLTGTDGAWRKWRPDWPTSAHWYTPEAFRSLIAAYLTAERYSGRSRSVREFVKEFDGLTGSLKQKCVLDQVKLSGARLEDLVEDEEVKAEVADLLLKTMQEHTRPVQPSAFGMLGEKHLRAALVNHFRADPTTVVYKRKMGVEGGWPFVLETAFAMKMEADEEPQRDVVVGLNWSPTLIQALPQLTELLAEMRIDQWDPVVLVVHLAHPCLEPTDRGKSRYWLRDVSLEALRKCVRLATRQWKKLKHRADREGRLAEKDLDEARRRHRRGRRQRIKEAAYEVMVQAYLHASDPGTYGEAGRRLPAEARQIMYAARPLVLDLTGGDAWKNSAYFTQHLLPDFVNEYPEFTSDWDVVFGARGALEEPHTGRRVPLGTVDVRQYIADWSSDVPETLEPITLNSKCPTCGPGNRYRFALFVEKQGFDALLAAGTIGARYDLALMSTKGMSVTAARRLVDELSERDVTILVLRDFDKSGFSIVHTLRSNTRRYRFQSEPKVIELGLRLEDAQALGLQSERVYYKTKKDPRERLRECGATPEECNYLVQGGGPGNWWGERVELNAMTASQFLQFLERKLRRAAVRKVVPDGKALHQAYRRAWRLQKIQEALDAAQATPDEKLRIPADLVSALRQQLRDSPLSWDQALQKIVREHRRKHAG